MTTQILKGITHKEVQNVMAMKNVPVSVQCMVEILQWAQQRTLEWVAETEDAQRRALTHTALSEITQASEEIGGYELPEAKGIAATQKDTDPAITAFVDANFWDLLTDKEKAK